MLARCSQDLVQKMWKEKKWPDVLPGVSVATAFVLLGGFVVLVSGRGAVLLLADHRFSQ